MIKKTLLIQFILLSFCQLIKAQDFPFGAVTQEEMEMKKYDKDTSAHALVLSEFGRSRLDADRYDNTRLTFEYHVKIKIFDARAFNLGTVNLRLLSNETVSDDVDDIVGTTSYIDDDGSLKKVDLDPKMIFKVPGKKFVSEIKFAMPGLRKGCIIEYKYRLVSPFWTNFKPWLFQGAVPKKYSEYETYIPAFWEFNTILKGSLTINKVIANIEKSCYSSRGASADCSHHIFGMSDIPAFVIEEYMTSPKNFQSALYFELSEYTNPYTSAKKKISTNWDDVENQLKQSKYFGVQLQKTGMLKKRMAPVIAGKTTDLEKAKAIYYYITKNIKWNKRDTKESYEGIEEALDKHTGNSGDINLALITALNAVGINTEAVLLSTRNNGVVTKIYPTIEQFDYVIAKANIGDKSYFLDASESELGFGMLPYKCLNGDGRAISFDKPSYWVPVNPDQKRVSTYTLDLTLQPDGKITGTMIHYAIGYQAYELRTAVKRFNSIDEYVDNLDKRLTRIKISKSEISNLDSLDLPIAETYQIELSAARNMNANQLSFNPILLERMTANPFKLAERNYPVDMGMPSERRFTLTMHLPDGYEVSGSQPVGYTMPGNTSKFITAFESNGNTFTFSDVVNFNKSIYSPDEYASLKEFYNKIIATEKLNLVFKKKL